MKDKGALETVYQKKICDMQDLLPERFRFVLPTLVESLIIG